MSETCDLPLRWGTVHKRFWRHHRHEQISQRNIALTAAQEHQIQEITENLNPLCKSVQKLYIKFAKDTQLNMTQVKLMAGDERIVGLFWFVLSRQRDMYEKAVGVEIQDLSGFINAFEQTSSEIDVSHAFKETIHRVLSLISSQDQIKTVREQLQKSLGKKKAVLEEGRKVLKKTGEPQNLLIRHLEREVNLLHDRIQTAEADASDTEGI